MTKLLVKSLIKTHSGVDATRIKVAALPDLSLIFARINKM